VLIAHSYEIVDGDRSREPLTRLFQTISFGELAVDGFFLLSGLLIVGSYLQRPDALRFLKNRILRIYPGFIACALISALIVGAIGGSPNYFGRFDSSAFLLGIPKLEINGTPPVFASLFHKTVNASVWTLKYEFQCYLLVILCGLTGILRRPLIWLSIGGLFLVFYEMHVLEIPLVISGRSHALGNPLYRLGMFFVAGGYFRMKSRESQNRGILLTTSAAILAVCMTSRTLVEPALAIFGGQ
jgi:peptidoglycan/LPS O-acetylase OafA/YrhL